MFKHTASKRGHTRATTAELVAAVSNAGGLGSLGAALMTPEQISTTIQQIRRLTDRPFAVNLFAENRSPNTDRDHIVAMNTILNHYRQLLGIEEKTDVEFNPIPFAQRFAVVLDEQPPVFSFTFGIPDQQSLQQLKARDIKTNWHCHFCCRGDAT
ncbi:MAG: nitronate monooxygenase [Gammaproteobacteria bacterium]|nr:nitronate monooxygenase [Gammaproteobacteria bacterium]